MRLRFEPEGELLRVQLPKPPRGASFVVLLVDDSRAVVASEPFHVEHEASVPEAQAQAILAVLRRVRRYQ